MANKQIEIGQIKPNPNNPRIIKDDKFEKLVKSIKDFPEMLELRPIILNDKMMVLGGNMRLKACQAAGLKKVPCIITSIDKKKQNEFIIKDNLGYGEWDWETLANEWDQEELEEWGLDVKAWHSDSQEDDYEVPDDIKTDLVRGDLIEIGRHRLLCGDSTNADDVIKVLAGKEPYLMVTDPPYGVSYDANWRNEADRADGRPVGAMATMKVNNDDRSDWTETWSLSPSKVAYIWHAGRHASSVQTSLEKCNYVMRSQIIWHKSNIVISRGDYHWKHEPCWYAVKKGSKGNWAGDRKQTTVWDIDKPMKSETGHSTQKPVECMARAIANHDGDVYDPFLGSGTTMVAAEQLGRICYGMEIDPKYCQVVIDRMTKLVPGIQIKINGKAKK